MRVYLLKKTGEDNLARILPFSDKTNSGTRHFPFPFVLFDWWGYWVDLGENEHLDAAYNHEYNEPEYLSF